MLVILLLLVAAFEDLLNGVRVQDERRRTVPAIGETHGLIARVDPAMFRNVATVPSDPIDEWPHEVFRAILEYGMIHDWRFVANYVRQHPWSKAALTLEEVLDYSDDVDSQVLLRLILDDARAEARKAERQEVMDELASCVARSGLTQAEFAERTGTSASRLSAYLSGKTEPRASYLVRARNVATAG
ncbi:MAG: helix-turn-helix transcriptional regulator [Ancrocorticia sp.]